VNGTVLLRARRNVRYAARMLNPVFKFKTSIAMHSFAFVSVVLVLFAASTFAADRDAQSVINELRLKQLTKNLGLTDEQQKKIKVLYAEEAKLAVKVNDDEKLSLSDKATQKQALIKATNEKIKPLLTPEQKLTFEQFLAKAAGRKKATTATAPGASPKTPAAP
jgi:Spy/CpxP family protein refolding chaperone